MDEHPEVGIAGCRQLDSEGGLWPTVRRFPSVGRAIGEAIGPERLPFNAAWLGESDLDPSSYERELSCDWTSGSFLFVRREALESAGALDERFFFYSEEVDFCLRVRQSGWEVRHFPGFTIVHHGGKTDASPRMEAQMAYARKQYARKHFGPLRRTGFIAAIALRHLIRWAAFSLRGSGNRRAEAQRLALMTLLGREKPPFGS
jgi:GT2 family glycosyltransferase